jgi:hypothetical protein
MKKPHSPVRAIFLMLSVYGSMRIGWVVDVVERGQR